MDMDKLIEKMRAHPAVTLHRGATREEIRHALGWLKVRLPKSYTKFLLECGWADINGDVIYGMGPDVTDEVSMPAQANWEQVRAEPQMPHYLIPVMADGGGNHFCLHTKKMKDGECPVVFGEHDHPRGEFQSPSHVSKKFAVWLARIVREAPDA